MTNGTRPKRKNPSSNRKGNSRGAPVAESRAPVHEQIAQRAYRLWQERGQAHGQDLDDWLEAESQLRGSLEMS
jgi:hypothetical protein